jgi:hypothetical protein
MTFKLVPSERRADGSRTARRYLDFAVGGRSILSIVGWDGADLITPLGWGAREVEERLVAELLRKAAPALPSGGVPIYVCPECGDIACGAITVKIARVGDQVMWSGFAMENGYEAARDIAAEAIPIEAREYYEVLTMRHAAK